MTRQTSNADRTTPDLALRAPDAARALGIGQRLLWSKTNAGEIPQLALHPASAGHGLNLQHGGRRMIWYRMTWSPELYAQACKRLARPGQKYPVYVHSIMADHPMERLRLDRVETKIEEEKEFMLKLRRV